MRTVLYTDYEGAVHAAAVLQSADFDDEILDLVYCGGDESVTVGELVLPVRVVGGITRGEVGDVGKWALPAADAGSR